MDSNVDTAEPQANVNVIDVELDDLETLEQFVPQLTALTDKHALGMWIRIVWRSRRGSP